MAIVDQRENFCKSNVNQGYTAVATTIDIDPLDPNLSRWPDPASGAYNAVWWNSTTYPDPADDPNVEIVRVTAISGASSNQFTITRGQEGTTATTKNAGGSTYKLQLSYTAKLADDLDSAAVDVGAETGWVTEQGAKGDGTTNDTAAISASVTAYNRIIFPPGTYLVDGDFSVTKSNLMFEGQGIGLTTIKIKDSATGVLSCFTLGSATNITFKGLTIDGNKANNAGESYGGVIVGTGCANTRFIDSEFKECKLDGLRIESDDCYVDRCLLDANDSTGILIIGDRCVLYGCRIRNNATGANVNSAAADTSFDSVYFSGNTTNLTDSGTGTNLNHTVPAVP